MKALSKMPTWAKRRPTLGAPGSPTEPATVLHAGGWLALVFNKRSASERAYLLGGA